MWSTTTQHKSKVRTSSRTNHIVHLRVSVRSHIVHMPLYEQVEPGFHQKAKVCPELPDEICEPSSSALKKNNQTQREEFLSWQSAVITEVILSSPSHSPLFFPSFSFPPLSLFLPTVWGPGLGSMWPRKWAQQRKPEHSGVSRWILAFVPLQRAGYPFDTAA